MKTPCIEECFVAGRSSDRTQRGDLVVTEVPDVPVVQIELVVPGRVLRAGFPRAGSDHDDRAPHPVYCGQLGDPVDPTLHDDSRISASRGAAEVMKVQVSLVQSLERTRSGIPDRFPHLHQSRLHRSSLSRNWARERGQLARSGVSCSCCQAIAANAID